MAIGRISGEMLYNNLERQGVDLAFEGNLLYLDVNNHRVGVYKNSPQYPLDVNGNVRLSNIVITGNTVTSDTGKINLGSAANVVVTGGTSYDVLYTDGNGNLAFGNLSYLSGLDSFSGNTIVLGTNTVGNLVSNAVSMTTSTYVTDGIAQLNQVLGKLVPAAPPNFPNSQTLTISSLSTYRMCNFTQTDNTTSSRTVAGGSTVTVVRRASSYTTSTITNTGPGDSGTVTAYLNSLAAGSRTLTTGSDNGTYSNLVIANNVDYGTISGQAQGFWESFSTYASGTVNAGWNEVYIRHAGVNANTSTAYWYYDSSAPGTPTFYSPAISNTSNVVSYSSTIPHFTSSAGFTLTFNVNKLSGDMYPTSDTFVTGSAGGAFAAPASVTYASASVTTPLTRNLYVSSGNASVTTTSNIISGFGSSSTGPSVSVSNSYNTGTQAFTSQLAATVLYKTGTSTNIEETSIPVTSVGTGSGNALRIINPGSTDTPTVSVTTAFNSQSSTLQTYDATVVGSSSSGLLKHDQTNYSTGYYPVGPNLSSGRSGAQYFTFKFTRTVVSKFDISITGSIAGCWVALPGSTIDSTSSANGWIDMSTAYAGSGIPGANTGAGGNGSNGCALGGAMTLNSSTTQSRTCTFGTVSSSSTATNEILVRIKLTSGQSVSALSIVTATH